MAEYAKALAATDAKNAAAAAQAKAAQEEYDRQRAAYEADLVRHAQEQAEYEAKLAAMPK